MSVRNKMPFIAARKDNILGSALNDDVGRASPAIFIMQSNPDLHRSGLALLQQLHGGEAGEQLVDGLKDICPDFATMTLEWALAGIMARPGLDLLTREFLLI